MRESQRPLIEDGRKRYGTTIINATDTCVCGCDSAEHTYGTAECQSCPCKKFHLKNSKEQIFVPQRSVGANPKRGDKIRVDGQTVTLIEADHYGEDGWWARTEQEVKNDEGQSSAMHEWDGGKCKTCGTIKTENCGMCNQIELGPYPAPGITNNVAEGRARYGRKTI